MLFPTITFALFFGVVFACSWLLRPNRLAWQVFLLAASYLFYGWWDPRFIALLVASTVLNQLAAKAIWRARSPSTARAWMGVAVAVNLASLAFFKYYSFFVTEVTHALDRVGLGVSPPLLRIILPVGISFFTFHSISYVVDVYRRDLEPGTMLEFAVYSAFFPHLVAGPIVRFSEFLPQLRVAPSAEEVAASEAFLLILAGLFKKVVIASYLGTEIVDPVFAQPGRFGGLDVLVAIYAYAIQIYADFSGYTDIAIGCALLLGIRFPQNFDRPYASQSVQDFWRRWHMTLSRWLRDYLYIPLGGSRGSSVRTYRNLMLTMLLGGLWHGSSWTFVVWGGLHGLYLCVGQARRARHGKHRRDPEGAGRVVVRWFVTFQLVCLAWVFFRAQSVREALTLLRNITDLSAPVELVTGGVLLAIGASLAAQFTPRQVTRRVQEAFSSATPVAQIATLGLGLLIIDALGPVGVAPFIYFQF